MLKESINKKQGNSKKNSMYEVSVSSFGVEQELFASRIRVL